MKTLLSNSRTTEAGASEFLPSFEGRTDPYSLPRAASAGQLDWSLSLQVFFYLQVLDVLTTWLGFRIGLSEASPFIRMLMGFGPLTALLGSKLVALGLGAVCVWSGRLHVIRLINYWYAALVVWNLALILSR